ncbi:fumarylacetoacetate hydrolase family protein [Sphingoaurantiacus capsulatus]|uniref:Fumarylacetoacetate hydrolase family protein n=1 Tax=Sphingoaurantiacus capsulatus TaxID=1771310 RepID=A0ABV7XFK4_9SPHN
MPIALNDPSLPPIGRIFCAAVNYAAHRDEMGRAAQEKPMIFTRGAQSLVQHGEPLLLPPESSDFDFEGELALIIGTPGRRISRGKALDHILGWTCFQDGTLRDWQRHTGQFTPGKNFDRSGSYGPHILTPAEFGDYKAQTLITRLNGEEVQRTAIDLMLFDVETLIEYISTFTELRPGDMIATGTCGGVGVKRTPPLFMKAGDRVEVEVTGLGILANSVEAERLGA